MHEFLTTFDQRLLEGQVKRPLQVFVLQCDVGFDQVGPSHKRNSEAQRSIRVLRLKPPPNSSTRTGSSCARSIEAFCSSRRAPCLSPSRLNMRPSRKWGIANAESR